MSKKFYSNICIIHPAPGGQDIIILVLSIFTVRGTREQINIIIQKTLKRFLNNLNDKIVYKTIYISGLFMLTKPHFSCLLLLQGFMILNNARVIPQSSSKKQIEAWTACIASF